MRVSQFEIYRLVQRALEALGAGYGVDRDGARSVAWLEARGLPGLPLLAADLPELERGIHPPRLAGEASALDIDAGGGSAIVFAGALMDVLAGRALSPGTAKAALTLRHARAPLFLVPAAVELGNGLAISIAWKSRDGAVRVRVEADSGFALALPPGATAEAALLAQPEGDVTIEAVPGGKLPPLPAGLTIAMDCEDIARRFAQALDHGIEVDAEVWRRIGEVAARVQVPASEESRLRGAGGGDANA